MRRLRYVSLVLVVAAALLATGTGAFTSVSADRTVSVAVVDDEEAFLGLDERSIESKNARTEHEALVVTNRFGQQVDVTLGLPEEATDEHPKLKRLSRASESKETDNYPDEFSFTLEPNEDATVVATVSCNSEATEETWDVDVTADGESVLVETTEEIRVQCIRPTEAATTTTTPGD